jgi:hypothetical protein
LMLFSLNRLEQFLDVRRTKTPPFMYPHWHEDISVSRTENLHHLQPQPNHQPSSISGGCK